MFVIQTICPMAQAVKPLINPSNIKLPKSSTLFETPQPVSIENPQANLSNETFQQVAQNFQAQQPQDTSWMQKKIEPLHPSLQKLHTKKISKFDALEKYQPKTKEKSSNNRFWDSAYKHLKKGATVTGLIGTTESINYAQQQEQNAIEAKKEAQQNFDELKQAFETLETTINSFDKDQTKWTDYHKQTFARYLSLYNFLLSTLTTEELITKYVQLKNELIEIEEYNFKNLWKEKLATLEKKWFESEKKYQARKAQYIDEYQAAITEHLAHKNKHIKDISLARNNSHDQLKRNIKKIKPTVALEKYKIKFSSHYIPDPKIVKNRTYSIDLSLPELPTAIKAQLNENNY